MELDLSIGAEVTKLLARLLTSRGNVASRSTGLGSSIVGHDSIGAVEVWDVVKELAVAGCDYLATV